MGATRHRSAQFGIYEADFDAAELRKAGVKIKVQQQPFKILQALLQRPGAVVSREELHNQIWPDSSFGDFDQAVNVAVAKLRTALGDSADNPRFIETIPRRGYRFIAPVQTEAPPASTPAPAIASQPDASAVAGTKSSTPGFDKSRIVVVALAIAVIAAVASVILNIHPKQVEFNFHRISFGKGAIRSARFGPDGHSVLYGAAWDGKAMQLFWTEIQSPESRPYSMPNADILAVSPAGQLAILLNRRADIGWISRGTLALMPIAGAAPREVLENVQDADWDHNGKNLAVVHWIGKQCNLEYPIGNVIYSVAGGEWLSHVRISPRGDSLAFLEHPLEGDDAGVVASVDLSGHRKVLTHFWSSIRGLAWDPSGGGLWFSASEPTGEHERPRAIYRVGLGSEARRVISESGNLTLHDVSREQGLLVSRDVERYEILGNVNGQSQDLSWLDFSRADDLSLDGKTVLLTVEGEAAGESYEVYVRGTDGSQPVKLGEGYGSAISPDGQWVLAVAPFTSGTGSAPQITLLPIGKGAKKVVTVNGISPYSGTWFPDGKNILILGSKPGHGMRAWVQDLQGGAPQPITPEGVSAAQISPDGKLLCAVDSDGAIWIYPIDGSTPTQLKGGEPGERPVNWGKTGRELLVARSDYLPVKIYRVDVASGKREFVRELSPTDPAGVLADISSVLATPDGTSFVYSYFRLESDLYMATTK